MANMANDPHLGFMRPRPHGNRMQDQVFPMVLQFLNKHRRHLHHLHHGLAFDGVRVAQKTHTHEF